MDSGSVPRSELRTLPECAPGTPDGRGNGRRPARERLPFVYPRFPGTDQTYAWWFGSLSPKMCAAYAAACVRRSMPSFWNRADT